MVTVKVDSRKRVVLPGAKPGQVLAYSNNGKGQITLLELRPAAKEQPASSILDGLKPFTRKECEECWGKPSPEFDALEAAMTKIPFRVQDDE